MIVKAAGALGYVEVHTLRSSRIWPEESQRGNPLKGQIYIRTTQPNKQSKIDEVDSKNERIELYTNICNECVLIPSKTSTKENTSPKGEQQRKQESAKQGAKAFHVKAANQAYLVILF